MSVENKEVPKLSLVEQLKHQHSQFVQQKEITQTNLNQLIGAIYACELMIQKHQIEESQQGLSVENLGGQGNGETHKCEEEQTA